MAYTIRNCSKHELPLLQKFINKYWKENHIMATSKALMDFQHLPASGEDYNFFIAINTHTGEIDGVLGYISTFFFDANLKDEGLFWAAIWKVKPDIEDKLLGLCLLFEVFALQDFKSYAVIGISNMTKQIYFALEFKLGHLNHYYIINTQKSNFNIAMNVETKNNSSDLEPGYLIKQVDLSEYANEEFLNEYYPRKTIHYLVNRYVNHPIYRYIFYGIFHGDKLVTILVIRKITVNNSNVLRIVDAIGELTNLPNLYAYFQLLLETCDAEYIDMLNYGIEEKNIISIGFEKLDFEGNLIIPNYFEPFEQRNVKIEFAYKTPFEQFVIFKGDSDQDRPNIL
jgi:hypothetical protein